MNATYCLNSPKCVHRLPSSLEESCHMWGKEMVVLVDKKAHWLGALSALPEDPSFVPRTHTEWLTAAWKFSSGGNLPFSSVGICAHVAYTHRHIYVSEWFYESQPWLLFVCFLVNRSRRVLFSHPQDRWRGAGEADFEFTAKGTLQGPDIPEVSLCALKGGLRHLVHFCGRQIERACVQWVPWPSNWEKRNETQY